jgi:hypothetical protein
MIHNTSCHPTEHKIWGINYLINRVITYPISEPKTNKEKQTIDHLLQVNRCQHHNARELIKHGKQHTREDNQNQKKWANFSFIGKETKFITKLFKDFNIPYFRVYKPRFF